MSAFATYNRSNGEVMLILDGDAARYVAEIMGEEHDRTKDMGAREVQEAIEDVMPRGSR